MSLRVIRDRCGRSGLPVYVRFAPKATDVLHCHEMTRSANKRHCADSFDDLVRGSEQQGWYGEAKRFGSLEVYGQVEFGRLLDR